jgi:hypothetical protein
MGTKPLLGPLEGSPIAPNKNTGTLIVILVCVNLYSKDWKQEKPVTALSDLDSRDTSRFFLTKIPFSN